MYIDCSCLFSADRSSSKNQNRLLDYHRVIRELRLPQNTQDKEGFPATKLRKLQSNLKQKCQPP